MLTLAQIGEEDHIVILTVVDASKEVNMYRVACATPLAAKAITKLAPAGLNNVAIVASFFAAFTGYRAAGGTAEKFAKHLAARGR
jgi:hypothetical protein